MRFPSFTINTSIFTFSLNNETRNWGVEYINFQLFGVEVLKVCKLFSKEQLSETEECPNQPRDCIVMSFMGLILGKWNERSSSGNVLDRVGRRYLLSIGPLVLAGLVACYLLNYVPFLFVLLPSYHALMSMSLYELPLFLANVKILISLCRATVSSVILALRLSIKGYGSFWSRSNISHMLRGFFVPDLICALVSVPVALYTPYGCWAAIASITVCSILKALAEGGAVLRLNLFPHICISVFEFVVTPVSAAISLLHCSLLAFDFRLGVPHDISMISSKALAYTDWASASDRLVLVESRDTPHRSAGSSSA